MCVYLYIHNKYSQNTYKDIYIYIYIYIYISLVKLRLEMIMKRPDSIQSVVPSPMVSGSFLFPGNVVNMSFWSLVSFVIHSEWNKPLSCGACAGAASLNLAYIISSSVHHSLPSFYVSFYSDTSVRWWHLHFCVQTVTLITRVPYWTLNGTYFYVAGSPRLLFLSHFFLLVVNSSLLMSHLVL